MFVVWSVTGCIAKVMARLIRNGWQNVNAMRPARGMIIESKGHFRTPRVIAKSELGPFFVTAKSISF